MRKMIRGLRIAQSESRKSVERFQMGACIIKGKRILGKGYNQSKSHPKGSGKYHHIHAETAAILSAIKAGYDLTRSTIYIYRKGSRLAKPCRHCEMFINEVGISSIVYTQRID